MRIDWRDVVKTVPVVPGTDGDGPLRRLRLEHVATGITLQLDACRVSERALRDRVMPELQAAVDAELKRRRAGS